MTAAETTKLRDLIAQSLDEPGEPNLYFKFQFDNGRIATWNDAEADWNDPDDFMIPIDQSNRELWLIVKGIHRAAKVAARMQLERMEIGAPHQLYVVCQVEGTAKMLWAASPEQLISMGYGVKAPAPTNRWFANQ